MLSKLTLSTLMIFVSVAISGRVDAGGASHLVKSSGRLLLRQGGKVTASQASKQIVKQSTAALAAQAARSAAKRSTATAVRHFGDDVIRVGSRFGDDLTRATSRMTGTQQRRLAIMAKDLNKAGETSGLVKKLATAKNPGSIVDDLWKHKSKIAAGVGAATVLVHGDDIAKASGEYIAKPMIDGAMTHVVAPVASGLGKLLLVAGLLVTLPIGLVISVNAINRTGSSSFAAKLVRRISLAISR